MKTPRLIIAGTHSGVGKTTIATGIMQLFHNMGVKVQGFKVGPDYIDPSYHSRATGRVSRNLDTWLLGEERVLELMARAGGDAQLAIIEGVMGLFDGYRGNSILGSTAHIAKITKSPVILIVDCRSMARSVAPLVYGFKHFDPEVRLAGVILNKVASPRHLEILLEALEPLGVPVVGHVFREAQMGMPERHLGLVPAGEMADVDQRLDATAETLQKTIDVQKLREIARATPPLAAKVVDFTAEDRDLYRGLRIGYAYDQAFSFYYRDGLDLLEHYGVELVPFSPLRDKKLPRDVQGLIFGGGFPELFLKELGGNDSMIQWIREAHRSRLPIYGECGGFMYLTQEVIDFAGNSQPLVGLIPGKSIMTKKLVAMGYREAQLLQSSILGLEGTVLKGHEFHYSKFEPLGDIPGAFRFTSGQVDGYVQDNLLASYLHIHWASQPLVAKYFLQQCLDLGSNGV